MSGADVVDVLVVLQPGVDSDADEDERLARVLRRELDDLDVESVRPVPGATPPDGAKAADAVTVGALAVALSASGGVLVALVETLRDWLRRSSGRHRIVVTIDGDTIELERASTAQQRELVDAYLRRHAKE
jgi:glycine/D-amino acid oxidase-like deaminating enzyme